MTVIYHEDAGDISILHGRIVGMIGYDNLARSMALNLRDSQIMLRVGVQTDEEREQVQADGLTPAAIEQVAQVATVLILALSDVVMPQVYLEKISPYMTRNHTLIFTSGYNITYGFIEAPPFVDVGMLAPRTIGPAVRERYLGGQGFYSFIGIGQDATGHAWDTLLALAKAVGSLRAGAIEVTLQQETELDLFIQQAVLPAFHHLMTTAARLLLQRGYPPEAAMLDLYISGEFTDYLQRAMQSGMLHALRLSSLTGQYGIFSRFERFNDLKLERLMEISMDEIQKGNFAQEWAQEYADGYPHLRRLLKQQESLDLWELEQQTIELLQDDYPDDFE